MKKKENFKPFIECPFNEYISRLRNPYEWGGDVEISALSLLYERDFVIYEEIGKPPVEATQNGFGKQIVLCFTHGNHYDSVFTKQFQDVAAICQAVVYEMLYKDVFKLHDKVDEAIDILRYPNRIPFPCEQDHEGSPRQQEHEFESSGEVFDNRGFEVKRENKRRPPFPYKVIKSLDPEIYRNVEFDTWSDFKKQQQHREYLISAGMQYALGDKCLVHLDDASKFYNAHIQDVSSSNGPVTVFIEEMGEKCTVPIKNLRPLNQQPQSYKCISPRSFRNQSGHISPHLRILKRGRFLSDSVYILGEDQPPYQDQGVREEKYSPYKQGAPRYLSPYRMRRGVHYNRQRTYSQGSDVDEHLLVDSSMYDLQDDDGQPSFTPMPVHVHQNGPMDGKSGCWGKVRRRGRTTLPMNHPRNMVHDHYGDHFIQPCDVQVDDDMYEEQVIDDGQRPQLHRRKTPSPAQDIPHSNMQEGHFVCADPNWSDSNSSIMEDKMHKSIHSNVTPPNMIPVNNQPSVAVGIPFCPIMLPATDNLTGPVNIAAGSSRDQAGSDLPLNDVSTLRFFYNLGFEYYHQVCIYQAQRQPAKIQGPEIIQYPIHYQTFPPPVPPHHQMQMPAQQMRPAVIPRMPYQEGSRCRSSSLGMLPSEAYYQEQGFAKPPPTVTTYLPVAQPMPPMPGTPHMQMAALNLDTPPVTPAAYQYPMVGPRQTAPTQQYIYRSPTKPNPQMRGKNVNGFIVV
ncbi:uncharacterized protein [Antedon mediterranea]|uniref:uncharacterized protein n=1 Tax=Antedon mediterranea TaxID=105859 RepID=UPI003AF68EB8